MSQSNENKKTGRRYSREFKAAAVKMVMYSRDGGWAGRWLIICGPIWCARHCVGR